MSVTDGLRAYLVAQSAITSIVGSTNPRVFGGNKIPEGEALPCVVYFESGTRQFHHMAAATGRAIVSMQIDAWAETYAAALSLAEALRLELDGYRGTMGSDAVRFCHLRSRSNQYLPDEHGGDRGRYVVSQDYEMGYAETVPTF